MYTFIFSPRAILLLRAWKSSVTGILQTFSQPPTLEQGGWNMEGVILQAVLAF
jgi:hypothetical protein